MAVYWPDGWTSTLKVAPVSMRSGCTSGLATDVSTIVVASHSPTKGATAGSTPTPPSLAHAALKEGDARKGRRRSLHPDTRRRTTIIGPPTSHGREPPPALDFPR